MNLFGLLSGNAVEPSSDALLSFRNNLTYDSFFQSILAAAAVLSESGIKSNDRVALLGDNSSSFVITVFALWYLKAIPVPLNGRLLNSELEYQIKFAECNFILYGQETKALFPGIRTGSFNFENIALLPRNPNDNFNFEIDSGSTALILFSSGSTGLPKAVIFSFKNLIKSAETGDIIFKHKPGDIWLAALPFYHIGGFSIIMRSFLFGTTLAIPDKIDSDGICEAMIKFNPTLTSLVTTQLKRILEQNILPNPALRHVLLGGGFIDTELVKSALEKGYNVSKSYGATETSSFVTALLKEEFSLKPESAGKALIPNKIIILGVNNNILPPGSPGEIAVESEAVAQGYLNNTDESERKFSGNRYYTGDFGYIDGDGFLFIEARKNDLIISGGENINPNEIERELLNHPEIIEVSVIGLEDKLWGYSVAAVLVTRENKYFSLKEIKSFLRGKLPSFKHPKKIFYLTELPRTPLGKIQKEKLKAIITELDQSL